MNATLNLFWSSFFKYENFTAFYCLPNSLPGMTPELPDTQACKASTI